MIVREKELYHFGVKGMKWGIRRYQNKDGTLTAAGKKRFQDKKDYVKRKHSKQRYEDESELNADIAAYAKKQGYKKWAKENYLDELTDSDQRSEHQEYIKEWEQKAEKAKRWSRQSNVLEKRLDSIDPNSVGYKKAMKMITEAENDWINENLYL